MAYIQKDNSGTLFENDRKEQETHADYTGTIIVNGVAYWINGWWKTPEGKAPFMSLSVKPKQQKSNMRPAGPAKPKTDWEAAKAGFGKELDDEIPDPF